MIGASTKIVIALSPDRIRGAVVRAGRVIRSEQVRTDPAGWDESWEQGLVPLDQPLRQLLSRLRPGRTQPRVTLLYYTRNAVVQSHDIPGSREDARRAGVMKTGETGAGVCLADAVVLGPITGKPSTWCVLGVADREEDTNKLYAWVTRCGARVERLVPEPAVIARAAVDRVTGSDETIACCTIGPAWSAIVVGSRHGIDLFREFEFGHTLLSDAFQRAMNESDQPANPAEAERVLFEEGLPFKSGRFDPALRARVLPLVAPVLQRFCVEIKQTLRFGLPADKAPANLLLDGPGAGVPHLAPAVTDTLNMHVTPAPGRDGQSLLDPFGVGTFERDWLRMGGATIELVPQPAVEQRQADVLRRGLAAGLVGAAALLGAEYAHVTAQNRALEPRFAEHATTLAALTREEDTRGRIERLADAAGRIASRVRDAAGPRTDTPGVLALLSRHASESVVFDEIEIVATTEGSEARLSGSTIAPTDAEASAALSDLVQSLQESPLIAATNLGSTTRETLPDEQAARRFQLTLRIKPTRTIYDPLADHAERRAAELEDQE